MATYSKGGSPAGAVAKPQAPPQYFDEKGNVREVWFNEEAEDVAKSLKEISPTQLRRFYEDVLHLRRRLDHEAANNPNATREQLFPRLRPEFKMLRAKAYYAKGRDRKNFPDEMKNFLDWHVTAVREYREFEVFCKHFQAVVAFHKYYFEGRKS